MPDAREILRAKTKTELPRDLTSQIKRCYADIEHARSQGFKYVDIAKWLEEAGITVTGKQLSEIMFRLRKRSNAGETAKSMHPPVIFGASDPLRRSEEKRKELEKQGFKHNPVEQPNDLI